jgi:Rha family phage regulatory protein
MRALTPATELLGPTEQTMSSREIAELTEKRHDNVMRDVRAMLVELHGEGDLLRFEGVYRGANGEDRPCFNLPKRETLILVSGYDVHLRAKIIDRWQQLEVEVQAAAIFESPAAMRGLLLTYSEKVIALETQVEDMREDVAAHERLTKADGSLNVTETAKNLGMRPKDLFKWLAEHGWTYKRPGSAAWLGYAAKCNDGLLEHKTTTVTRADGTEKITEQVRVTPKGLSRLAKLIKPTAVLLPLTPITTNKSTDNHDFKASLGAGWNPTPRL